MNFDCLFFIHYFNDEQCAVSVILHISAKLELFSIFCLIFDYFMITLLFNLDTPILVMPSQKPRLNLTLSEELNATITRLSELTGRPKSTLVVEMLEQYAPVLDKVVLALEQIQSDKENGKKIAKDFGHSLLLDANIILGELSKDVKDYD